MNQTWDASLAAMNDLQFTVTDKSKDALSGYLTAQTADNKTIKDQFEIHIEYLDGNPHSGCRTFGDEAMFRALFSTRSTVTSQVVTVSRGNQG